MNHLVVFARWPESGSVLKGFEPALPPSLALELHLAMLSDVLAAGRLAPADRRYLYWADPPVGRPWSEDAREAGYQESIQRGATVGLKLEAAFEELLHRAGERVVVVGAGVPELTGEVLGEAFARLDAAPLVLGPTPVGRGWLVGLSRLAPEVFRDIPWGTDRVIPVARERAAGAGLAASLLAPLPTVDTPADLTRLALRCATGGTTAANTAVLLRRWGLLSESWSR